LKASQNEKNSKNQNFQKKNRKFPKKRQKSGAFFKKWKKFQRKYFFWLRMDFYKSDIWFSYDVEVFFFCRNFCHLTEISVRFLRWPKTKKSQNLQILSKNFLWLQKFLRKFFFPKRYLMYKCKSYYNHCGRSRIQVKKKIIKKKKNWKKKKIHLWAKFHIWVQKFLHSQKNLKNANLRYKLLSVTYNNILRSIPLKFDIFTKILDENLTFFFFKRLAQKGYLLGQKKRGTVPFFVNTVILLLPTINIMEAHWIAKKLSKCKMGHLGTTSGWSFHMMACFFLWCVQWDLLRILYNEYLFDKNQ